MKKIGIRKIMEDFGCSDGVPSRVMELKTINLRSNGNQELSPVTDEITFDLKNELIKIKEYDCKLIGGIFIYDMIDGKEIKGYRAIGRNEFSYKPQPKIGDSIVYISKSDKSVKVVGKILSTASSNILSDKDLPESSGFDIGYADSIEYASSSQYMVDQRYFVKYIPVTEFPTDIYLSFYSVVGFSTSF